MTRTHHFKMITEDPGLFEFPQLIMDYRQLISAGKKNGYLVFKSDPAPGDPLAKLFIHFHRDGNGVIRFDDYKCKSGGDLVSTGNFGGFDTGVKKVGQLDDTESAFNIWDGTTRFVYLGNNAANGIAGTVNNDRFVGKNGTDYFGGKDGNDTAIGGNGGDQLVMGNGNDTAKGGGGADFLYLMDGRNDFGFGQGGNDIIGVGAGKNVVKGGAGADVFMFNTNLPDIGGAWDKKGRTVIKDFEGDHVDGVDVLVFHNLPWDFGPLVTDPGAETLADIDPTTIPGFDWEETNGDLKITVADQVVILRATGASDVDLDRFVFSGLSEGTFVDNFVDDGANHVVGGTLKGGVVEIDHTGADTVMVMGDGSQVKVYATDEPHFLDSI